MKKLFTLAIATLLFGFFSNYVIADEMQIPVDGEVRDSVYVWDNFNIDGDALTNENGNTGGGWTGPWTYQPGHTDGVTVGDGSITNTKVGFGIQRNLLNPIPLGESTFYIAFVINKTEDGNFRIDGNRADGINRYAIGVGAEGQLYASVAQTSPATIGAPGVVEGNKTYLVVSKWWYSGNRGHMNIVAYKGDDAIPTSEPEAGSWDLEGVGGATGVPIDYFRFAYVAGTATIHDFKVGDTWTSVTDSLLMIPPTNLEALGISPTEVRLNWVDNSFQEEGFRIYLNGNEVTTVGPNVTDYTLSELKSGETYTFGVSAFDGDVETTVTELEYEFEFDPTPPVVVSTTPENNDIDVVETSDIVIRFSKVMNTASVEDAITVEPALENAEYAWSAGGTVLRISSDNLMFLTQYTVTVAAEASDLAGITMESAYEFSFTTIEQDLTPPTIISISPANNATDVLVTSDIRIVFSEAMNRASVEGAVTVNPPLVDMQFRWIADSVVSVVGDIGKKMDTSTEYTANIATTATDLAGNALEEPAETSFTTGETQLMLYDDFSIADGALTNINGSSGQGWAGPWTYVNNRGAVVVSNEYITGGTDVTIVRPLNHPYMINATTYYMSFLATRSPEGAFDVFGGRFFGGVYQFRTGVGFARDGSVRFRDHSGHATESLEGSFGAMEEETTYLVVMKHTHRQKQQVRLFKLGDEINEPDDTGWDFEMATGNTGVRMDYVGIIFNNAAANIDELKVGLSWDDVVPTEIVNMTEFPLIGPTRLKVIPNSTTTAILEWADHSVVEDGFHVYLDGTRVASTEENEDHTTLRNLVEGQTYTVKVSALKGNEEAFSEELTFLFEFDADYFVNTRIFALKTEIPPIIDGNVDDVWANAEKHPVRRYSPMEGPPVHEDDFELTWSVMWDDNNIYFLFEVVDDVLVLSDEEGTAISIRDGFEIPMANAAQGTWVMNRLNLIEPTDGGDKQLYIHQGMTAFQNAQRAFALTEKGYTVELSMVLRDFDESIGLFVDGYQFRMDVRYNDSDIEGVRRAQYTWTDKNDPDWSGGSVRSLGHVTLLEEDPFTSITEPDLQMPKIPLPVVYLSNYGTTLNVLNYEGEARLFSITGMQIMSIQDATQPVNVSHLPHGVYILNTKAGSVKFIK